MGRRLNQKSFDEFKNKFFERKAWASKAEAKTTQANFLCMAHNLCLLVEHELETKHNLHNEAENKRRAKRQAVQKKELAEAAKPQIWINTLQRRATQLSVKFVRWLGEMMFSNATWDGCVAGMM